METAAEFKKIIESGTVRFTKPQQYVIDKLLRGDRLIVVNQHHKSGGQFAWKNYGSSQIVLAGHVYKAFYHIGWAIRRQTGREFNMGIFVVKS
jgi:hypothetical protein